jgi:gliding motility-associated protein GldC
LLPQTLLISKSLPYMKSSEIKFEIKLDENNIPEVIQWEASDSGTDGKMDAKSIMLSIWDQKEKNSLRIDLWTKDMTVDEMKIFFHQTLVSMADTFEKATSDDKMAGDMKDFCQYFAEKQNLYNQ